MSESRRILTPYAVRHWPSLAGVGVSTAVLTVAELAAPWPLKLVIDRIAQRQAPFELDASDVWFLALVAGLVLAIALVGAIADYASETVPASGSSTTSGSPSTRTCSGSRSRSTTAAPPAISFRA
jgi:ABC-type multidrug transport system fused ATPase/permease subunit